MPPSTSLGSGNGLGLFAGLFGVGRFWDARVAVSLRLTCLFLYVIARGYNQPAACVGECIYTSVDHRQSTLPRALHDILARQEADNNGDEDADGAGETERDDGADGIVAGARGVDLVDTASGKRSRGLVERFVDSGVCFEGPARRRDAVLSPNVEVPPGRYMGIGEPRR
ncbi:hypothetical protein V500_00861 [Pseudogymnoascus sp. VKM F-4518 (FW-2643)]|nr:hypothetical protein V500_00861 [Pseudogymnoascus sp. VKM F-4518 (FW-2643)]